MPRFVKKPVEIEARRLDASNGAEITRWIRQGGGAVSTLGRLDLDRSIRIHTLNGPMVACPGDWVIRDVMDEFYPLKPDVFGATYELARPARRQDTMSQPTKTEFQPGDVLYWRSQGSMHAKQGVAIVSEDGRAIDTFWGVSPASGGHVLTKEELATAAVEFNLGDFRQLGHPWEKRRDEWLKYRPEDRQVIGSQGPRQATFYVREGAKPDLATMVANAEAAIRYAEEEAESARRRVEWRREDLARLLAEHGDPS